MLSRNSLLCASLPWRARSSPSRRPISFATPSPLEAMAGSASRKACEVLPTGSRWASDIALSRCIRNSTKEFHASNCLFKRCASSRRFVTSDSDGFRITSSSFEVFFIMRSYSASRSPEMLKPPAALPDMPLPDAGASPSSSSLSIGGIGGGMSSTSVPLSTSSSPKASLLSTFLPLYFFSSGTAALILNRFSKGNNGAEADLSLASTSAIDRRLPAVVSSPRVSTSAGSKESGARRRSAICSATLGILGLSRNGAIRSTAQIYAALLRRRCTCAHIVRP
mmetsp:Transcript_98509/g.257348  ORF Transcript_98509/g.257348 Transcript_98509/m.257348 type:complete len:280 (-) Transcript_98509:9-848(-)